MILLLLAGLTVPVLAPAESKSLSPMAALEFLLGDWEQAGEEVTIRESWRALGPGVFRGTGVTLRDGDPAFTESLVLIEMAGAVYYLAKVPGNRYPVPFELVSYSTRHATFENPQHDSPQRLEYRLESPGSLRVRVSDPEGGFEIQFKKVSQ